MENILKVNLYVDGNYLYHIANHIRYGVEESYRSVIDWSKLVSYLLSFLQTKENQRCAINVKKYFIGSGAGYDERRQGFYNAIEYAGIQRISFPLKSAVAQNGKIGLKEDAVDTLFTFTASKDFYSVAREDRPDIICIAAGDSDYIPLVEGLKSEGARIVCMYFDFTSTTSTTRASQLLLEKSDYIVNLETLLKERVDENAKAVFQRIPLEQQRRFPAAVGYCDSIPLATLCEAINQCSRDNEGYVLMAEVGKTLDIMGIRLAPGIKLKSIVESYVGELETKPLPAYSVRICGERNDAKKRVVVRARTTLI